MVIFADGFPDFWFGKTLTGKDPGLSKVKIIGPHNANTVEVFQDGIQSFLPIDLIAIQLLRGNITLSSE